MDFDVFISWDNAHLFRFADRAKVRVLAFQLNDPEVGVFDWMVDLYMHPSQWHADRFTVTQPFVAKNKQTVRITNGVDYTRYLQPYAREPKRVIYSSSPDRGLHHLLRIWPRIVEAVPDATLHVFYDMSKWLSLEENISKNGGATVTSERAHILTEQIAQLPPSVTLHGGVGQGRLAIEQLKSCVMVYPCDPVRPTEGFSMTVLEGITAGLNVVTSNADAFPELWYDSPGVTMLPLPVDDDKWVEATVSALRSGSSKPRYNPVYAWSSLAQAWEREIITCLRRKHAG
jgi:glycosyltransferase involved in cell wall biosynthesis